LTLNEEMSIDNRYVDDTTLIATIFDKLSISTAELEAFYFSWICSSWILF